MRRAIFSMALTITGLLTGSASASSIVGFNNGSGFSTNGAASSAGNSVTLTQGALAQAGSVFATAKQDVSSFVVQFDYLATAGIGAADGVTRTRLAMVDSRNAARVRLAGVRVGADAVLGTVDGGGPALERLLDAARVGLAAEMLGSAAEAFERTVQYLKDRKQFGVPIGSFQALKHRAAVMFAEIEATRSAVLAALVAQDEGAAEAAALASLAKAKANETLGLCSGEGIQMHGGIGMTDEHEIGFFLKRSRVAEITFGGTDFHRDRYAALNGF